LFKYLSCVKVASQTGIKEKQKKGHRNIMKRIKKTGKAEEKKQKKGKYNEKNKKNFFT